MKNDIQHDEIQHNDPQNKEFFNVIHIIIAEHCYTECHILFIIMLNVIMLSVILLNVVMLSVIMLSVVMLNAVAPFQNDHKKLVRKFYEFSHRAWAL